VARVLAQGRQRSSSVGKTFPRMWLEKGKEFNHSFVVLVALRGLLIKSSRKVTNFHMHLIIDLIQHYSGMK
jgi:hypothetical protein